MFEKPSRPMKQPWPEHFRIVSFELSVKKVQSDTVGVKFPYRFCSNSSQALEVPFFLGGTSKISCLWAFFKDGPSSHHALTLNFAEGSCFPGELADPVDWTWSRSAAELMMLFHVLRIVQWRKLDKIDRRQFAAFYHNRMLGNVTMTRNAIAKPTSCV